MCNKTRKQIPRSCDHFTWFRLADYRRFDLARRFCTAGANGIVPGVSVQVHAYLTRPVDSHARRSARQVSHLRLARLMDRPHHLRFLITNPRNEPKANAFSNQLKEGLSRYLSSRRDRFLLIRANLKTRTVLSLWVAHWSEPMTRRNRDGRA